MDYCRQLDGAPAAAVLKLRLGTADHCPPLRAAQYRSLGCVMSRKLGKENAQSSLEDGQSGTWEVWRTGNSVF